MPEGSLEDSARAPSNSSHHAFGAPPQLQNVKEIFLPPFGLLFFNHLLGEYESFTDRERCNPEAYRQVLILRDAYLADPSKLTWGDLAALECLLLHLRTDLELRERFSAIQSRYQEVALPSSYSRHPQLAKSEINDLKGDELRARIEAFACEFFRVCVLAECRESMRAKASKHVSLSMLTLLGLYVFFHLSLYLLGLRWHWPINIRNWVLPGVMFAGAMGGFVSAQRRLQSVTHHGESVVDLINLSYCVSWLAPISGAIFAVILYAMFGAGLLTSNAFPRITIPCASHCGVFSTLFSLSSGPENGTETAKLAVWCFIAGFAERFVPNALDRFVSDAEKRKKSSGSA